MDVVLLGRVVVYTNSLCKKNVSNHLGTYSFFALIFSKGKQDSE